MYLWHERLALDYTGGMPVPQMVLLGGLTRYYLFGESEAPSYTSDLLDPIGLLQLPDS